MATRLYFPLDTASEVNPAFGGWTNVDSALRRKLADVKGASAITIGTRHSWAAVPGENQLDRQYVSAPMNSGISFSAATVKLQIMTREYATADNSTSRLLVKIVNREGDTIQQTLLALGQYGPATEYVNNVSHRNKSFANGDTVAGTYTTGQGDRLVVEIGHTDASGATPEASCKFGENATDAAENETGTADAAGWIEFSNTITFEVPITPQTWLDTFLGTDTFTVSRAKQLLDTFLGTDVWNITKIIPKEFFDAFLGTDLWTLGRFKTFADTLLGTDSWLAEKAKQFLDIFTGTDSWLTEKAKIFADTLLGTDLWTQYSGGGAPAPVHQMNMSDSKTVLHRRPVGFYEEVTYRAEIQDILPVIIKSGEINLEESFPVVKTIPIDQESKFKVRQVKLLDHKVPTSLAITSSMESVQKIPVAKTSDLEQLDFLQIATKHQIDLVDKVETVSAKTLVDIVDVVKAVKSIPVGAAGLVPRTKTRFERTKTSTQVRQAEDQVSNKLTLILNKMKNRIRENNATLADLQDEFASQVKTAITISVRDSYMAGVKYVEKATRIALVPTPAQMAEINSISEERENQFWRQAQELINQEQKEELERTNVVSMMPVIATSIATISLALGTKSATIQANNLALEFSVKTTIIEPTFEAPKKMRLIWITEKDFRVCPICRRLDGQIFFAEDPDVPQPVEDSHENCRCRLMIYDETENKVFNG